MESAKRIYAKLNLREEDVMEILCMISIASQNGKKPVFGEAQIGSYESLYNRIMAANTQAYVGGEIYERDD